MIKGTQGRLSTGFRQPLTRPIMGRRQLRGSYAAFVRTVAPAPGRSFFSHLTKTTVWMLLAAIAGPKSRLASQVSDWDCTHIVRHVFPLIHKNNFIKKVFRVVPGLVRSKDTSSEIQSKPRTRRLEAFQSVFLFKRANFPWRFSERSLKSLFWIAMCFNGGRFLW